MNPVFRLLAPASPPAGLNPAPMTDDDPGAQPEPLQCPAREWFAAMDHLGERVELVRNAAVAVGRWQGFAALTDWRNPFLPRSRDGSFSLNLAEFVRVQAVREMSPQGPVCGFEAFDGAGQPGWRSLLLPAADPEPWHRFVHRHRCPPERQRPWLPLNHVAATARRHALERRAAQLRALGAAGSPDTQAVPTWLLGHVLPLAQQTGLTLVASLFSRAAIAKVALVASPAAELRCAPDHLDWHGPGGVGFQVRFSALAELWLWRGTCACCQQARWTLEGCLPDGSLGFSLHAGDPAREESWRELLKTLLRTMVAPG